jgi:hypothetical protein
MNEITASLEALASLQSDKLDDVGAIGFLIVLIASAVSCYVASLFYLLFFRGNSTGSQIHRVFPLLGISITAIFVSIQFSLPLSLGLLGALSIVRFRTPIKEPEEIGFLMLVVALSLSCAIFNFEFVLMLLIVSLAILVFLKLFGFPVTPVSKNGLIVISVPRKADGVNIGEVTSRVSGVTRDCTLESVTDDPDGGLVITYRIAGARNLDVDDLIGYIKGIDASATAEIYQS